jgi:hypothetical protein
MRLDAGKPRAAVTDLTKRTVGRGRRCDLDIYHAEYIHQLPVRRNEYLFYYVNGGSGSFEYTVLLEPLMASAWPARLCKNAVIE